MPPKRKHSVVEPRNDGEASSHGNIESSENAASSSSSSSESEDDLLGKPNMDSDVESLEDGYKEIEQGDEVIAEKDPDALSDDKLLDAIHASSRYTLLRAHQHRRGRALLERLEYDAEEFANLRDWQIPGVLDWSKEDRHARYAMQVDEQKGDWVLDHETAQFSKSRSTTKYKARSAAVTDKWVTNEEGERVRVFIHNADVSIPVRKRKEAKELGEGGWKKRKLE